MGRHVSELSLEELSEAAAAAGEEAVRATFALGLPVTGLIADKNGKLRLGRLYPDGSIEWIDAGPATEPASHLKVAG